MNSITVARHLQDDHARHDGGGAGDAAPAKRLAEGHHANQLGEQHRCLAQGRDMGHGPLLKGVEDNGIADNGEDAADEPRLPLRSQERADVARAQNCDADHERNAFNDVEPHDVAPGRCGAAYAEAVDYRVAGDEECRGKGQEDRFERRSPRPPIGKHEADETQRHQGDAG